MSYYNTTKESVEAVKKYRKINNGQDSKVLGVIIHLDTPFSASMIWKKYMNFSQPPITSIRRSINTLKNLELIEETGKRVMGLYGRSELQYKLTEKTQ